MALTSYINPFTVSQGIAAGGGDSPRINNYRVGATGTYYAGDVVITAAGGTVTAPTAVAATDAAYIAGVVAAKTVTTATTDTIPVYDALPGVVFSGHIVGDATACIATTAVASDMLGLSLGLVKVTNLATLGGTATAYALSTGITTAASGACVRTVAFAKQQYWGTNTVVADPFSPPAILSPRINFVFSKTWWTTGVAGGTYATAS